MRALPVLAAVAILMLSACGSGHRSVSVRFSSIPKAASRVSHDCARRDSPSSDVNGLLWLRGGRRPLVYYRSDALQDAHMFSSQGRDYPLWGVFWPCDPPVIIYGRPPTPGTRTTVLAPARERLGRQRSL